MNDLYRLVYTSRNLLSGEGEDQGRSVARIMAASRRNNARDGVTGALLFNADTFAQVLEGPRVTVEATFERIQRDPRHDQMSVLQCEGVSTRVFPHWSMAFAGRSARGRALWDGLARDTGFDLRHLEGDSLCATLLAIVQTEDAGGQGLDVDRLRSALKAEGPQNATVPDAVDAGPPAAPAAVQEQVLRAALDEERRRTTELRGELDAARIALAGAGHEIESLTRHRDIWSDRSHQLRSGLDRMRETLHAAETERDALRGHIAAHDAVVEALSRHRDVWAERARALAHAFCGDPALDRADGTAVSGGTIERGRPSLVKAAR